MSDEEKKVISYHEKQGEPHLLLVPGEGASLVTSGEMRAVRRGNPFLDKLGSIMEDPDFRSFFNEYFQDWGDAKVVLMIMYTYNYMDELYYEKIGNRLSSDELVYLIKKMLHLGETRRMMVDAVQGMIKKEGKFRDQIEKLLIDNFSEIRLSMEDKPTEK